MLVVCLAASHGQEIARDRRDNYPGESLQDAMEQATALPIKKPSRASANCQMCLGIPEWADKGLLVEELIDRLRDLEDGLIECEALE